MTGRGACLGAALAIMLGAAHAQPAAGPDLPPAAQVAAALGAHPAVLAARAGLQGQRAAQRGLRAGPHEFNVRVESARRSDAVLATRTTDWTAVLEKPLRLPGKARIDEQLGDAGVALGEAQVGEAWHEAARELLELWFGWTRAAAEESVWDAQVVSLTRQRELVDRRVSAGDAAQQEAVLARAALAQADFSRMQAAARARATAAGIEQSFGGLKVPLQPLAPALREMRWDVAYWREVFVASSHELAGARAETARRALMAERARADFTPDPTLGVRYAAERDRADRIVGVFVSVPFPGQARLARSDEAAAQLDTARSREAAVDRRLSTEATTLAITARAAWEGAARADEAAGGMSRSAEMTARAYVLGESALPEVLLARRLAVDANLAATQARIDAARARYRLMLDAHQLWPSPDHESAHSPR